MEHAMDTGIFPMVYGAGVSMHSGPFFRVGVASVIVFWGLCVIPGAYGNCQIVVGVLYLHACL